MTYQDLRRNYPKFIYEKYESEDVGNNLEIKFFYSIPPDHKFTHKISIKLPQLVNWETVQLENLIFHVGLSLMPSYWKTTCSPVIEILAGPLTPDQIAWWHKLFIKGMGEYFYTNKIDFTDANFLKIVNSEHIAVEMPNPHSQKVLVPVGGGKDSVVTLELLKSHFDVIPFVVNPAPLMHEVIRTAGLPKPIIFESEIDIYLHELNKSGYLNGHVPVTATHSFEAVLAAYLTGSSTVAFSNERSSNEGNTTYLGHEINHQYSKSLEFETDFNNYLKTPPVQTNYFSFLRPLYELQIAKLFSKYPQYFDVFSSCNRNFTTDPQQHPKSLWCQRCPKCVSTGLLLSPFIGKGKVTEIMGSYPPNLPENKKIIDDLIGKGPVKPFECVLTRTEAQAAFTGKGLNELLASWLPNPNMPKEFEKILKEAL